MTQPLVSLCMIVRNEEANLAECLNGIAGLVGEIVIVDTGSTDSTKQVASGFGAPIIDFPWIDDFAAARNESRRHATGKWIFWLDADDRIDPVDRERLRRLFGLLDQFPGTRNEIFMMSCVSRGATSREILTQSHGRLFPNHSDLVWRGRVHERTTFANGGEPTNLIDTDVIIHHLGYENPELSARKQQRDLRILEDEHARRPDDPITLFYLGRIRVAQNQIPAALELLARCIQQDSGRRFATTTQAYAHAAECLQKLGRLDEAIAMNARGLTGAVGNATLLFQRGNLLCDAGRLAEAEACFRALVNSPPQRLALAGIRGGVQTEKPRQMLGQIYHRQGKLAQALDEYRTAAEEFPNSAESLFYLGQLSVGMGLRDHVNAVLAQLDNCTDGLFESALLRGMACQADRNFAEGKGWLDAAIAARPGAIAPWLIMGDLLFQEGTDPPRCIEVYEKAVAMGSLRAEIHQRLAQLRRMTSEKASELSPHYSLDSGSLLC